MQRPEDFRNNSPILALDQDFASLCLSICSPILWCWSERTDEEEGGDVVGLGTRELSWFPNLNDKITSFCEITITKILSTHVKTNVIRRYLGELVERVDQVGQLRDLIDSLQLLLIDRHQLISDLNHSAGLAGTYSLRAILSFYGVETVDEDS